TSSSLLSVINRTPLNASACSLSNCRIYRNVFMSIGRSTVSYCSINLFSRSSVSNTGSALTLSPLTLKLSISISSDSDTATELDSTTSSSSLPQPNNKTGTLDTSTNPPHAIIQLLRLLISHHHLSPSSTPYRSLFITSYVTTFNRSPFLIIGGCFFLFRLGFIESTPFHRTLSPSIRLTLFFFLSLGTLTLLLFL